MKLLRMAGRSYVGYRLKAASILVFMSLAFTLILGGSDLLYNSYNIWFDRAAAYSMPRFFVSAKPGFDFDSEFAIRDIALKTEDREALQNELSGDFGVHDTAFFFSLLYEKDKSENASYAFVVAVDFARLGEVFPHFKGKLSPERIAEYKARPLALVNDYLVKNTQAKAGMEFVLASENYYRDFNAIRLIVADIDESPLKKDDLMGLPTAFMDISQLGKLFALPEDRGPALILVPKRPTPVFSLRNRILSRRIEEATEPRGLGFRSSADISANVSSTFSLYRSILDGLVAVLAFILVFSVSSNLFLSFQGRRSDFGLYKAFGCGPGRLFALVLAENALGIALPLCIALAANLLAGALVKPFPIMGGMFTLAPGLTDIGLATLLAVAAILCILSVIRSYRYLARLDPAAIMREE